MGTNITPEISDKKKYYISKHRYYELLHFCRQYSDYKKEYKRLWDTILRPYTFSESSTTNFSTSGVERAGIEAANLDDKIKMIEGCARDADYELAEYILIGVTTDKSYDYMKMHCDIPCSRNTYYNRYRKFYYLLDKVRG